MGAEVRISGSLIARAGARHATVPVTEEATVVDIVEQLAEEYGPQVRPAILDGGRLRSDTVAFRELPTPAERLAPNSRVHSGDTLRFEVAD